MAVSGCLKDVKFAEVLKIVGRQTGRLWIYNMSRNNFSEWTVHQNLIRAVRVNGAPATAPAAIHEAAVRLGEDVESSYIFYALKLEKLMLEISMPVGEVVVGALAATDDNAAAYRDDLPHPDTRFQANYERAAALSGDLREFYQTNRALMQDVFSAREIAAHNNLNVEAVQLNFYKLRAVGAIQPARVLFRQAAQAAQNIAPSNVAPRAAVQEPATAVFNSPQTNYSPQTNATAAPTAANNAVSNAANEAANERKGWVKQMLNAISFRKKFS